MPVNKKISFSVLCLFLTIGAVIFVHNLIMPLQTFEELPYSEFRTLVTAGNVAQVAVTQQRLTGTLKGEEGSKSRSCLRPFGLTTLIWSRSLTHTTSSSPA